MAIPTLTILRANTRRLCQDPGTTPQALVDADIDEAINRAYLALCTFFPERFIIAQESWVAAPGASQVWSPSAGGINVRRILSIGLTGTRRLGHTELNQIIHKQEYAPSAASPTRYFAFPDHSSATVNRWKVYLYGTAGGTLDVSYEFYPPELANGGDQPRFPDAECKWIEQIAAARCAWLNGKNQAFYQALLDGLPDQIKTHFQVIGWLKKPRLKPDEVVA